MRVECEGKEEGYRWKATAEGVGGGDNGGG